MDLTLGSGWPFGGPGVPIAAASAKLRIERRDVPPGDARRAQFRTSGPANACSPCSSRVAGTAAHRADSIAHGPAGPDGVVRLPADLAGPHRVQFFIASRTGMQVKRAAIGGEGFVLDHYDRDALDGYLSAVGDRLMTAFRSRPPFAVFCDSLEAYEGDWTGDLLDEFRRRRGYDLDAAPARPRRR